MFRCEPFIVGGDGDHFPEEVGIFNAVDGLQFVEGGFVVGEDGGEDWVKVSVIFARAI
jgi:hypothetical protein